MLSWYALQALPLEWFGAALILLAVVLFVVDLNVTNHGLPSVGGVVALILGVLALLDLRPLYLLVSMIALVAIAILIGVLFVGGLREVRAAKGRPATTGMEGMIGEVGIVREPVGADSTGWVFVHGELWQAVPAVAPEDAHKQDREPVIGVGRRVQVVGLRDGKVVVLPLEPTALGHSKS
jgi:membrane-bound serine protease (ClpP class)